MVAMGTARKFDVTDYLNSEETIAENLTDALEDQNPDVFLVALGNVAKARGITLFPKFIMD
jgi:probable addiction module antidote protein